MGRAHPHFDALSTDVFALLACFLTGFDLLALSHANRRLFQELLAGNSAVWRSCLPDRSFAGSAAWQANLQSSMQPHSQRHHWKTTYKKYLGEIKTAVRRSKRSLSSHENDRSWKQLYFTSRSLRFPGCTIDYTSERKSGSAVKLGDAVRTTWNSDAFSFDLWFALLPMTTALTGGILLGAQCVEWPAVRWSDDSCQQFVYVDRRGDLHCSMTQDNPVVASRLQLERWYHVTLTLERSPHAWAQATQRVYLDGTLIHSSEGALHPKWRYLNFAQLGSGCLNASQLTDDSEFLNDGGDDESNNAGSSSSLALRGWYGFNGVVDDCRFWRGALTDDQVQLLFRGQERDVIKAGAACAWSLTQDSDVAFYGSHLNALRCTRPRERVLCCVV